MRLSTVMSRNVRRIGWSIAAGLACLGLFAALRMSASSNTREQASELDSLAPVSASVGPRVEAEAESELASAARERVVEQELESTQVSAADEWPEPQLPAWSLRVLRGGAPLAGVIVADGERAEDVDTELWRHCGGQIEEASLAAFPAESVALTDEHGRAALPQSKLGLLYVSGHGPTRIRCAPPHGAAEFTVPLGDGRITGTVFDEHGAGRPGVHVITHQLARAGEAQVWAAARTDASGWYAIEGLDNHTARELRVSVFEDQRAPVRLLESLPAQGSALLELGRPEQMASVEIRLRLPWGDVFESNAQLVLRNREALGAAFCQPGGTYLMRVPAGVYAAELHVGRTLALGEIDCSKAGSVDVALPGLALIWRCAYVSSSVFYRTKPQEIRLRLVHESSGERLDVMPLRDGGGACLGLEPGRYRLAAERLHFVGHGASRLMLDLEPGDESRVLELTLTDRP